MSARYRNIALLLEVDSTYEDPKQFLKDVAVAFTEGDEDVRITIAGVEYHVTIIGVDTR
jgi:predicted transport protein